MSEYAKPLRLVDQHNSSLYILSADVPDEEIFEKYLFSVREEELTEYSGWRVAEQAIREINAFAALLAVAEAADRKHLRLSDGTSLGFASRRRDDPIVQALEALDAAHPGWREWTP